MRAFLLTSVLACAPAWSEPVFTEQAAELGITHQYTGGWEHFVGGGIATFDCNGDYLPEIFAAGGEAPSVLLRNDSTTGTLLFREQTPNALAIKDTTGAYPIDIDSDGHTDLVVLRVGENLLLRGLPDCEFEPFGLDYTSADRWTTAFSAAWEHGSRLPTLAFGNYVDRTNPEGPFEACDANMLYRPLGDRYMKPHILLPGHCALSLLFSDWGRHGRSDLRVSNDRHYFVRGGAEQMWAMEHDPRLYTQADGWRQTAIWGMGIASRDINGDGIPEVFLTSMADQKLQSLDPTATGPTFLDAPYATGTTAHRPHIGEDGRPSTGWHAAFGDVNNDSRDDLFIAKGNVEAMPSNAMEDPNNLLLQEEDGSFSEVSVAAGVASMTKSRGAALVDLNLDGKLDLVVANRNAPIEIYRNVTQAAGNWLMIAPRLSSNNRDAIGAWIEIRTNSGTQTRERTIGGGHAGGSLGFEHFGLGSATHAEIRIQWPDGPLSGWHTIEANRQVTATRGSPDSKLSLTPLSRTTGRR
jgi:hypothetical protein